MRDPASLRSTRDYQCPRESSPHVDGMGCDGIDRFTVRVIIHGHPRVTSIAERSKSRDQSLRPSEPNPSPSDATPGRVVRAEAVRAERRTSGAWRRTSSVGLMGSSGRFNHSVEGFIDAQTPLTGWAASQDSPPRVASEGGGSHKAHGGTSVEMHKLQVYGCTATQACSAHAHGSKLWHCAYCAYCAYCAHCLSCVCCAYCLYCLYCAYCSVLCVWCESCRSMRERSGASMRSRRVAIMRCDRCWI